MVDLTPYTPYIIGALLGAFTTILGYSLNEYSKRKDKKEKRIAARKMIKYEIDHNIKLLEQFYCEIRANTEENEGSLGFNMGDLSFPPIDNATFNKFSFLLSNSKEKEFENIYNFYKSIGDLQIIHSKTSIISNKSYEPIKFQLFTERRSIFCGDTGEEEYKNQFSELWAEFESIICSLIKEGNPIIL